MRRGRTVSWSNHTTPASAHSVEPAPQHALQICFLNCGDLHQRAKQPGFQRSVTMERNDNALSATVLHVDVVAAVDACQTPTASLNYFGKISRGDLLQRASSRI